jgi:toxin ParE1/3/4
MITRARRRVVWSSPAELEIAEAAVWYEEQQVQLGDRFLHAVEAAADVAARSPEIYARVHGDMRRVLVHRFPYGLIVRESPEELLVVACYHLHRDPQVWRSRD